MGVRRMDNVGIVFDGFDAAEVDASGRITVLLAFSGAPPAPPPGR